MTGRRMGLMSKSTREIAFLSVLALGLFALSAFGNLQPLPRSVAFTAFALGLALLFGPSLRWGSLYFLSNATGKIEVGQDSFRQKARVLQDLCNSAGNAIQIVIGEFNREFFEQQEVLDVFQHALRNNVRIEIISGDRDALDDKAFLNSLMQENPRFLCTFGPALLDGSIRFYYGKREAKHFYLIDHDTVILEDHPRGLMEVPWQWKRHTAILGEWCMKTFDGLRSTKRLLDFKQADFSSLCKNSQVA